MKSFIASITIVSSLSLFAATTTYCTPAESLDPRAMVAPNHYEVTETATNLTINKVFPNSAKMNSKSLIVFSANYKPSQIVELKQNLASFNELKNLSELNITSASTVVTGTIEKDKTKIYYSSLTSFTTDAGVSHAIFEDFERDVAYYLGSTADCK